MFTDAHCHPFDLEQVSPGAETLRRRTGVLCASSATTLDEFVYCEGLSHSGKTEQAPPLLPCFAIHPQICAHWKQEGRKTADALREGITVLEELSAQGRLAAVGETGFDLFNAAFRETEHIQDELFNLHLQTALRCGLPLVLHVRRAMHKIFAHASALKKCPAVVFHSWSGTEGEGQSLLKQGINAFFSFGTAVLLNHRQAMRCAAFFPAQHLLSETDAPYQPLRGSAFSSYADLPCIVTTLASLRQQAGSGGADTTELSNIIENNFYKAFNACSPQVFA